MPRGFPAAAPATVAHHEGTLPAGATWVADVPTRRTGTLVRFSRFGALEAIDATDATDAATREQTAGRTAIERVTGRPRPAWNAGVDRARPLHRPGPLVSHR